MAWALVAADGAGNGLIRTELAVITLLVVAALVAIAVHRIRLPYTVALVLVGLALSFFPAVTLFELSQDLILAVLVPPLLFEAALRLQWRSVRQNLGIILLVAVVGTLISTLIVGYSVAALLDMNLAAALAFGALISATDPVAVVAFFRTLGVSQRLTLLVEGESLFNDGIAIVLFHLALAIGIALRDGVYTGFGWLATLQAFVVVASGGLLIGAVFGGIVAYIVLKNVDDHLIETTVTLAVAYGAYLFAEYFGSLFHSVVPQLAQEFSFSGILAVVAASLFIGNVGRINTSPTTRVTLDNFWELLTFVVNSLVFLLIGLKIDISQFRANLWPIAVAVVAVLVGRAVVVYVLFWLHGVIRPRQAVSLPFRHVIFWGGLRGAVSLALALALTGSVFGAQTAERIHVMTFGVVLFTLLVQGLSIEQLIKRLGLVTVLPQRDVQQRLQTELIARRAGQAELVRLREQGVLSADLFWAMNAVYEQEVADGIAALGRHLQAHPELEQELMLLARGDALRAERAAVNDAALRGLISSAAQAQMLAEIDARSASLRAIKEQTT